MLLRFLLTTNAFLLLLSISAQAQESYNRWEASKPEPVAKPVSSKPKIAPVSKDTASMPLLNTTDGKTLRVQCMPVFPGGEAALENYLRKRIKRPAGPRQRGTVQVTFTVLTTGAVSGVNVKPGNGLSPAYDEVLINAISNLPPIFEPGGCNGNHIATEVTMPYTF